jgi:hypothetical protein
MNCQLQQVLKKDLFVTACSRARLSNCFGINGRFSEP